MNFWCSLWACGLGLVWFGREWLFPEDGFLRQRTGNGLGLGPWLGPSLSAPAPTPGCQARDKRKVFYHQKWKASMVLI